ncbi:sensor histidine kinase [Chitinophagaceae bacterium MMS25-I14]
MKVIITITLLFLVHIACTAQISDRLYKLLPEEYKPKDRTHITDGEKRLIVHGADEYASHADTATVIELNQIAAYLEHAGNKDSILERTKNLSVVGDYHRFFLDRGKSAALWIKYYQLVIDIVRSSKNPHGREHLFLPNAYIATGNYFEQCSHYEEAAENYTYALTESRKLNDTPSTGAAYVCLSNMYQRLRLFGKAIVYVDSSLLYSTAAEKEAGLAATFQADADNDKAWYYISWYKQQKNKAYLDSSWSHINKIPYQDKKWASEYYYAKSRYYFAIEAYEQSLICIDSSLALPNENPETYPGKMRQKGLSLLKLGRDEGKKIILENLNENSIDPGSAILLYNALYTDAKEHGNMAAALQYFEQVKAYEDSVSLFEQQGKVFEVVQKYNLVQKEAEIKTLESKNLLREKQRNQAIFVVIATILILLVSALFFRNRIRKQQLDKLKLTQELQQEKQQRNEIDFLNNIETKAIIQETVITERKEISEDLHDELGSSLASLKFYISDLRQSAVMDESRELLSKLEVEADFVYEHARSYMHSLNRQSAELQKSYNFFLEDLLRQFPLHSSLNFDLDIDYIQARERLQPQEYNQVVQIIRESIINILKHAHATEVKVSVRFSKDDCTVSIKDNGVGFSNDQKMGLGLKSIQNRADQLNGTCTFQSGKEGTNVIVAFPLTVFETA